ncbi:MAG: ferredoxin [Planctomycetota bacterium]
MTRIRKVWIEEGCISCSLCQDICAKVFEVKDGLDCVIRPDAAAHFAANDEEIREAAQDCPVEVIKFSEETAE